MAMDSVISAALEEICSQGASGLSISSLWPKLSPSLSSHGPPLCPNVKNAVWTNLINVVGLQFEANGVLYQPHDPKISSLKECERVGLKIIASENLLNNFVGIYDIKASDSGIPPIQRRVLDGLAFARTNGIPQSKLAKEFGIKGNYIFHGLKDLQCRGLIVRNHTVLRTVKACGKKDPKTSSTVTTKMLHLHRFSKHLSSQQRLEITKKDKTSVIDKNSNFDLMNGDEFPAECAKEDVRVKDFLPILKAICDKLELADGKVLVVADIKCDLGYKKSSGHKAWGNILKRLKDAHVVEEFSAKVNKKLLELPIQHQIYDNVDAEGSKGLTIIEVCKRLGLNNKRYYDRLYKMFDRFGMKMEPEDHNRTLTYQVWTPGNSPHEASTSSPNKPKKVSNPNDTSNAKSAQKTPNIWTSEVDVTSSYKLQENATEPEPPRGSVIDNVCIECTEDESEAAPLDPSRRNRKSYQTYPCLTLTAASARREQLILQILQEKKFVIRSELRRELDSLEKDKKTMTDRKTIYRALDKLHQEGHCKCITVSAPAVTNCLVSRTTKVILLASINLTPDLLGQIDERLRSFENGLKNAKMDFQAENSEAMRADGFVLAKMVRAKLLHIYLWSYLSNSPGWGDGLLSGKHGYDSNNPHSTCKLFSLDAAIKAMPLELYLQVVGSAQKFEDMTGKCSRGLHLSDLPEAEYKCTMDIRAMGRLSSIVDMLRRLKVIRLVWDGQPEDNASDVAHITLSYAMEVKPYIEEPVSVIVPSCGLDSFDLGHQIRHDFVFSSREDVDTYWNTLEYSYAGADSGAALLSFPGSSMPEVLRVYYDKRQRLPRFQDILVSQGEDLQLHHKKRVTSSQKRKRPSRQRLPTATTEDDLSNRKKLSRSSNTADYLFTEEHNLGEATEEPESSKEREHLSLIHDFSLPKMNLKRTKRFAWREKAERKLVVGYARERAARGPKIHHINWSSFHDLPAPPDACKRRMTILLNSDKTFRNAMMRLCTVLGQQYAKHLDKSQNKPAKCDDSSIIVRSSVFRKGSNSNKSDNIENNDELRWDNFENEDVKLALEEVLRFKLKKRSGSAAEWSSLSTKDLETDPLETSMEIDNNSYGKCLHRKFKLSSSFSLEAVLSQQFLRGIFSSSFPFDAGKRAARFSRWICEKEKDFIGDGTKIPSDLQCGEIFHICALVFTGEFSLSPCLPDEGIGEPEDSRISKNNADHDKFSRPEKTKKRRLPSAGGEERFPKGFPGIKLLISRARLLKIDAVDMFKDSLISNNIIEADQANTYPSENIIRKEFSSNHVEEILNGGSSIAKGIASTELEWESMTRYSENLISLLVYKKMNPFNPELFKNICSAIQKAGDQGLTIEEVTRLVNTQEKDIPELVVRALEAFGRVVKVNSYDSVHVVDSLYRSKYFLNSMATFSQHVEVMLKTVSNTGDNDVPLERNEDVNNGVSKNVEADKDGMHKITILNLPKEVLIPSNDVQNIKDVEGCDQVKDKSTEANPKIKTSDFHPGDFDLCRLILLWVNSDGTINKIVYKGLLRHVLGILMQNPGMLESCRELLKLMIMDNYITVRKMIQRTSGEPPSILTSLFRSNIKKSKMVCREHFFANPLSTNLLKFISTLD